MAVAAVVSEEGEAGHGEAEEAVFVAVEERHIHELVYLIHVVYMSVPHPSGRVPVVPVTRHPFPSDLGKSAYHQSVSISFQNSGSVSVSEWALKSFQAYLSGLLSYVPHSLVAGPYTCTSYATSFHVVVHQHTMCCPNCMEK